ncbi:CsbD family protein [Aestuariivirga sp.]|uniref:CsbD family protein n=1 Tax=Aestuariivirga sp. TaxID=2650926 RepID=UPI00391A3A63
MDWDRIEGNWKSFKGKAKQQWGRLTDDDLDVVEGRREELEGRLQRYYGFEKDRARNEVDQWLKSL